MVLWDYSRTSIDFTKLAQGCSALERLGGGYQNSEIPVRLTNRSKLSGLTVQLYHAVWTLQ